MTLGQDALIMDFDEADRASGHGSDLGEFDPLVLKVLSANAQESQAHEKYLEDLDKAAGKPCAWRQSTPNAPTQRHRFAASPTSPPARVAIAHAPPRKHH